jgi:hypothetical protein
MNNFSHLRILHYFSQAARVTENTGTARANNTQHSTLPRNNILNAATAIKLG